MPPVTFNNGFDQVLLCNMALSKLGSRSKIASISENSAEADACRTWYKISLAQTLSAFNWGFARAKLLLTESTSDPDSVDWAYRYDYPANCLLARFIENPAGKDEDAIPYEVQYAPNATKSILTNQADAKLVYTIDVTDIAFIEMYPVEFINAFTSALAANMGFTLTGDKQLVQMKQQEFLFLVRVAAAQDGNQEVADKPREAEGIRGRA